MRRLALAATFLAALCGPAAAVLNTPGGAQLQAPITSGGGGGGGAPISNVSAAPGSTTATVTWNTALASASSCKVNYGTTSAYGSSASDSTPAALTHSVALSGLAAATTYHYQATCSYSAYSVASADTTFTTTSNVVTFVQASGVTANAGTPATTLTSPAATVAAGHTICASVVMASALAGAVTGIKDDLNNPLTIEASGGQPSQASQTYDWLACKFNETAGSRTVTATFDNTKCPSNSCTFDFIWFVEFTGGAQALDGTPTGLYIGTATSPATGTAITTANASSMMYELGSSGSNMSAAAGFTAAAATGNATLQDYYSALGAAGSYSPKFNIASSNYAVVLAVALH